MSWHSSDGIVTTLWNGKAKNLGSILGMKQAIFFHGNKKAN
jgi:hypothetical protein